MQLQRAYLLLDVAEATLKEREQIYALTRDRNAAGLDSRLELKQAETGAARDARTDHALEGNDRAHAQRSWRRCSGRAPTADSRSRGPPPKRMRTIALPTNVPAELVGRRPDLVAQRWRIEAAQQDIATAKAEFYPNVNLAAFVGLQSLGSAGFLTAASRMLGIGPAVTLPIFDGGRLRANLAGNDADYDIAVEQYNQTLADALRDVVDQLASFRSVDEQRAAAEASRSPPRRKPTTSRCCAIAKASATTCRC